MVAPDSATTMSELVLAYYSSEEEEQEIHGTTAATEKTQEVPSAAKPASQIVSFFCSTDDVVTSGQRLNATHSLLLPQPNCHPLPHAVPCHVTPHLTASGACVTLPSPHNDNMTPLALAPSQIVVTQPKCIPVSKIVRIESLNCLLPLTVAMAS